MKRYRRALGWTQAQTAEKAGLSTSYYSAIENGLKIPQLDTLIRICNILGASMDLVLADLLDAGINAQTSELSRQLDTLPQREKTYILAAVKAMVAVAQQMKDSI